MALTLETPRLRLRELTEADFPALCRFLQDERVMYAWEHAFSDHEVRDFIAQNLERYEKDGFSYLAAELKTDGRVIGVIGPLMERFEDGTEEYGVAYILSKDAWGEGYATEAARACLDYEFQVLGVESVILVIRPENHGSRGVADRLGFVEEEQIVRHYRGKEIPHLIYRKRRV